ncbi:MAG: class D sortase [Acidimicrobiales bacterium]
MIRWARVAVGLALVWGALGILGYRLGWQIHSNRGQAALLKSEKASLEHGKCVQGAPAVDGQLAGVLAMPQLGVTAPVEQGTGDTELNVAVGHADATPLPGQPGTAVLLAHDVSYFARIDQLAKGSQIQYTTGCATHLFEVTGHTIVTAGAPIPQQPGNGLVLDTCWPTNALWYTPNRYLVEAQEVSVKTTKTPTSASAQTWPTGYVSTAPPALVAEGLTLATNSQPMGTLTITGTPNEAWAQSPAPLAVESAALASYFGGLKSAAQHQNAWWAQLAPGVAMPGALSGATVTGHDAPLDVTITTNGDQPTSVTLSTKVTLSGGPSSGEFSQNVTEAIQGLTVVIKNWEVGHG